MTNETLIWRQALKDDQHPLHRAAWILFSEKFNLQFADRALADQKTEVIEFIYQLLDNEELYLATALGKGFAPINSVQLLGHWQITEAIPRLLQIIEDDDWDAIVTGKAATALGQMGSAVFEPLLEFDERTEKKQENMVAGVLADACKDDPRAYDYLRRLFEKKTNEQDIAYMAENLLVCDPKQAIPLLEERLHKRKYSKDLKTRLEKYLATAKMGHFP